MATGVQGTTARQYPYQLVHYLRKAFTYEDTGKVLVIVVIHPTKEGGLKGAGSLSLYDAADSSHWVNKVDYGIKIESDHQNQQLTVEVGKVRHRPTGRRGSTIFQYIPEMELISQ